MKKILYILIMISVASCSKESANDCFQNAGTIIQQVIPVTDFEKILVNRDVELIIKEAPEYQVIIQTGEYLLNDVEAKVVGDELQLIDNNTCNYVRDYGITKVFVSAPNIRTIRTSSQYTVKSDGVLNYDTLNLLSEDFNAAGSFTIGDFNLEVNTNNLRVVSNNISSFYISGETNNLTVQFYSGAGRFEGANLMAQTVDVYHRGSNDMIVNPQQSLSGELVGTGDLISVNRPPTVEVEQLYTGGLIFD
ncbi:head GIN domain-containing protein [Hanstruepera ponticola]|uniref:head GIN domain-containing protein n=1 Tax=Hanstruepera ponticola TaxID=2042995 RepID=UPI0017863B47|nr:head GIN domain-containing protein [Hanstruepera ponticola]